MLFRARRYFRFRKDEKLYDLHTFTYRNGKLFRYNISYIVLPDTHPDFKPITTYDDNDNIMVEMLKTDHIERNYKVDCEGRCECVEKNIDDEEERRYGIGNIVYSHRYVATLMVSIIGFAGAKFVNDHIDDCHEMAMRSFNGNGMALTCSLDYVNCQPQKEETYHRYYKCNGHCISRKFMYEKATKAVEMANCEEVYGGVQEVLVLDDYEQRAKFNYAKSYLTPICKSIRVRYNIGDWQKEMFACKSSPHAGKKPDHIKCRIMVK